MNWFTTCSIFPKRRSFGPASPALFEEVIDPVQSKKADEDQIDSHCEAHDPRRDQQEYPRDHGGDRQKVSDTVGVHRGAYSRFGSGRSLRASPALAADQAVPRAGDRTSGCDRIEPLSCRRVFLG